ncbi:hypothetical protein JVU11DRAFT_10927 [Chiua virens]|nr:hypothetical protein JVU11DRAFT_10927 [Chiua virens]
MLISRIRTFKEPILTHLSISKDNSGNGCITNTSPEMSPPLPPLPSEWVFDTSRNPPAYIRPLVGSELVMQQHSNSSNGAGESCIGLNLASSLGIEEMRDRARRAVDKLRFVCPIIACTIEKDAETLRWVYTPSADREAWLDLAFAVEDRGALLNSSGFVSAICLTRLPHADRTGTTATYFRVYLLTTSDQRDNNSKEYGLYFHAPHSILDAGPALHGLNLLCGWMSGKGMEVTIRPSEEWKNLPVDQITATGGPMKEWETSGTELLQYVAEQRERTVPYINLAPPSRPLDMSDLPFRRAMTLSEAETAAIVAQTKKLGVSVTALFYAANILAQHKMNPNAEAGNEVDFAYEVTTISLERYAKPPVDPRKHVISFSTAIPLRFSMAQALIEPTEKGRLIKTAKAVQERYDKYLANPCLPQLLAVPASKERSETIQTVKNPWRCRMINLGVVEKRVKPDHGAITVEGIDFSTRRGTLVAIHMWTMHSKLHFLVQGAAAWGEECLKMVLEETMRIGLLVMDKPFGKL